VPCHRPCMDLAETAEVLTRSRQDEIGLLHKVTGNR
jgi:hypothetical protein